MRYACWWGWIMASVYDGVRSFGCSVSRVECGSYLVQPVTTARDYTPLPNLGEVLK